MPRWRRSFGIPVANSLCACGFQDPTSPISPCVAASDREVRPGDVQLLIIVTGVARTGRVITAAALIMSISCAALMRRWCEGRRETGARAGHLSSPRGAEGVGREVALHPECRTFYTEIYMFSSTNGIADIIDVRMVAVCHVAWAQSIMINMGAPGPESVSRRVGSPKPRPFTDRVMTVDQPMHSVS